VNSTGLGLVGRSPGSQPAGSDPDGADRRTVGNLVIEARKFSGLAVDTLVELTKDTHTDSTRYSAATALLDRGYGRPAQSLDLHLSADAITKRLSDMTDAELAALEQRMIAAAPIVLESTANADTGEPPAGDAEDSPAGCFCLNSAPATASPCRAAPRLVLPGSFPLASRARPLQRWRCPVARWLPTWRGEENVVTGLLRFPAEEVSPGLRTRAETAAARGGNFSGV